MALVLDVASWLLLVVGGIIGIAAGVGMLRLPDVYTRMHSSSMLDSLGSLCVVLGLALQAGPTIVAGKLVVLYLFLLLTAATSGHVLAKAALAAGVEPVTGSRPEPAAARAEPAHGPASTASGAASPGSGPQGGPSA